MKTASYVWILLLTLTGCMSTNQAPKRVRPQHEWQAWHGNVTYELGYRNVSDLGDAEGMATYGLIDFDFQPPGFPVSIVIALLGSFSGDVPDEVDGPPHFYDYTSIFQFDLGLRKYWTSGGRARPFVGAGVSFVDVEVSDDDWYYYDETDSDSDVGTWVGGGVDWGSPQGFFVGFEVQYVFGTEVELENFEFEADSLNVLLRLGFAF